MKPLFIFCCALILTLHSAFAQTNLSLNALPLQVNFNESTTQQYTFNAPITSIISRNPGITSWTIAGNTVTFTGVKAGRTGLKIVSNGQSYYMGMRVNHANGSVPGLPQQLSIGSVSEDLSGDLAFWKDIDTDATNKAMDIRYIYINGGAIGGWQSWGADRPAKYARESLRHGLIPFFVYYNIPDNGESYQLDLAHAQDPAYMTAYFADINAFMDSVQNVLHGELYGIILEPDFLGYMQQNAVPNNPHTIPTAVGENTIAPNAGTIASLVHRINKTVNAKRIAGHKIFYGWQINLWSYDKHAGSKGIMRKSDALNLEPAKYLVGLTAEEITKYAMNAGVLSNDADFISIDKYGLDAMGQNNTPDPADCTWFFNNDHWNNYLHFAKKVHETANKPVVLWQLPVGRINGSLYQSAYTNALFPAMNNTPTQYEDSSTDFFLGDNIIPNIQNRNDYFAQNKWNDPKLLYTPGTGIVYWQGHLQEAKQSGIIAALFGAGVNASTDGVGSPPSDNHFWIQKVQNYYQNGAVPLSQVYGENNLNPCAGGCTPGVQFIDPVDNGKIVRSQLDSVFLNFFVNDIDGKITSILAKIDGVTFPASNLNDVQRLKWAPPSSFGFHTLSVTVTDNDNRTRTQSITFEIVDFNATACGYAEYDVARIYNTPNTIVAYNGLVFRNKWYTVGDVPYLGGTDSPWELESVCPVLLTTSSYFTSEKNYLFEINPNPSSDFFQAYFYDEKNNDVQLNLCNIDGKIIATQAVLSSQNTPTTWNTQNLPAGVYFLQAIGRDFTTCKKVVVSR